MVFGMTQLGVLYDCDIHVRNGAIAAIGPRIDAPAATVIDASKMIAMPGLIDTHNHLWNSMEKSVIRESITGKGYFPTTLALGKRSMCESPERADFSARSTIAGDTFISRQRLRRNAIGSTPSKRTRWSRE